jgi:hypothetical protein
MSSVIIVFLHRLWLNIQAIALNGEHNNRFFYHWVVAEASIRVAPSSVAATGASSPSFDHLDCSRNPRRDETMRCAVASRRGSWNDRRDLVAVLESLPGAVRLDDEHSVSGGICSGSGRTSADACAIASADAIGFIVSEAAASRSVRRDRRVDQIDVGAGSSVSLPRINCRLGQRALELPFPRHEGLRRHEARCVHARGRRPSFRQSRGEERAPSISSMRSECSTSPRDHVSTSFTQPTPLC